MTAHVKEYISGGVADYIGDKRAGLYDATDAKASQEVK